MCMTQHTLTALNRWNWEGDEIIHESIVPSSRPIAGVRKSEYDIDIREFLVTENNEVMKRTIHENLKRYVKGLSWGNSNPAKLDRLTIVRMLRRHMCTSIFNIKEHPVAIHGCSPTKH